MGMKPLQSLQPLYLDFVARRRSPWAGRVLLAVAVAFSADVGWGFYKARTSFDANKAQLARTDRSILKSRKTTAEEVAVARETVQRLSTPWDNLFGALEAAATEQVALLAVEPDPRTGTVVITGDSKDYLAALTYVLNLSRVPALSQVHLVRHEPKGNAVNFAVSASWSRQ
jgi:hypothetical protein